MKFEILKNLLFEKYIETIKGARWSSHTVWELNVNEHLSSLSKDIRGVITKNGDFYTASLPNKGDPGYNVIHADLDARVGKILGMSPVADSSTLYDKFDYFLNVQRLGNTNEFYLGESYRDNELNELMHSKNKSLRDQYEKNFKQKNLDKKLNFQSILDKTETN